MVSLIDLPIKQKVYAYVLRYKGQQKQLLAFEHRDLPEAGWQVPGGTVEPGEEISKAVQREAEEETGLRNLLLIQKLGSVKRDMRGLGLNEIHHRHYYHFECEACQREDWIAAEVNPSDGTEGPIAFHFYWVDLEAVPPLHGGLDEMLSGLRGIID